MMAQGNFRVGVRAHDFGRLPAEELAARIEARGLSCVQLAVGKAISVPEIGPGKLSPGLAYDIGCAFRRHNLQIAVLGCYVNPIHPDPAVRRAGLDWFHEHLRFTRDFGCSLVALETGSVNADYSPNPANQSVAAYKELIGSLAELVEEAERCGAIVGVEGVTSHVASTPMKLKRVLDDLSSKHVQVVFDPVNFLSVDNYKDQDRLIAEAFDLFGDRIVAVHAKDFTVTDGVLRMLPSGTGQLDNARLFGRLAKLKPGSNVLLEEVNDENVQKAADVVRKNAE